MTWDETSVMEQRFEFVMKVVRENYSVAEACRQHSISRNTGYKWLDRWDKEGIEGLKDRSRAPDTIPHKTAPDVEKAVCTLRKRLPNFGPKKLKAWLTRQHPDIQWPHPSTIGRILERNDLIEASQADSHKSPPYTDPLEDADRPNRIWSADFKGEFELSNGQVCYPLTVTDNYSRRILGTYALGSTKTALTKPCFKQIFKDVGVPEAIRTDNGAPFASNAPRGLSQLSAWWVRLGIKHERIPPGKPQKNGRHERMHLTLKEETTRPAESTMEAQQKRFNDFRDFFNKLRPHEALGQVVPDKLYEPCQKDYPSTLPSLDYPNCDLTRKVNSKGTIKLFNRSIYVSEAIAGYHVGLVEVEPDIWTVNFAEHDIGIFENGETKLTANTNQKSTV